MQYNRLAANDEDPQVNYADLDFGHVTSKPMSSTSARAPATNDLNNPPATSRAGPVQSDVVYADVMH